MKTDDLINALVADRVSPSGARATLVRAVPVAVAGLAVVMFATLGLRPDAAGGLSAIAMKLAVTLSLAAAALFALPALATTRTHIALPAALAVAPLLLVGFVTMDLATQGMAGAGARLLGTKFIHCLVLIPLLSAIPLAALLFAMKRGTPAAPARAGALAGLAAAGIGASFYALNCVEDSPLFVAFWYTIAALTVAAAGGLLGSRLLRW